MAQNIHPNKSMPYKDETGSVLTRQLADEHLEKKADDFYMDLPDRALNELSTQWITT